MQLVRRFSRRTTSSTDNNSNNNASSTQMNYLQRLSSSPKTTSPMANGDKFLVLDDDYINKFDDIVVVGDIHGCSVEFEELLNKVHKETPSKNPNKCLKIIVGDLVNKGPNSKRVLQICADKYPKSILSVRGNHDQIVLALYKKYKEDGIKCDDKNKWIEKLPKSYVNYLNKLPYSITIPSLNCIIVHAGVDPSKEKPAIETQFGSMLSMRNIEVIKESNDVIRYDCTKDKNRGAAWATFWPGPEHVYFGHDARRRLQDDHEFATGLDTGCVYGDRLSFVYIKGARKGEIFSIEAKQIYQPVEDDS